MEQPLDGFTVVVTADRRAEEQAELVRRRGADVVLAPAISTCYLGSDASLRETTERLLASPPQVVVVLTGIGFRAWLEAAQAWRHDEALLVALRAARVIARGPKSAAALMAAGITPELVAEDERSSGVRAALVQVMRNGDTVAVQCDGTDRAHLDDVVTAAGAALVEVPVYRWSAPTDPEPLRRAIEATIDGQIDAFTFTSAPAVQNALAIADASDLRAPFLAAFERGVVAACVGPVCAEAATSAGLATVVAPRVGRLGLLVRALTDALSAQAVEVEGTRLQGRVVVRDNARVELTRRDAAVLAAVLDRPGAVVARSAMLRRAWPRTAAVAPGTQAVDAAVARLRRRLEPLGLQIVAERRRGYRLVTVAA